MPAVGNQGNEPHIISSSRGKIIMGLLHIPSINKVSVAHWVATLDTDLLLIRTKYSMQVTKNSY